ncbi:MAG: tripartite tricarboxylate transporter TctB family protein [Synergistetes bacterium]|nr:tripartite tricarboxylate transporter TctB family protein [Synergistota bacterium]MDW8192407.1 tripartite tricarboxylate transporter TctB family protein [Synergistota bacterium]
MDYSRLLDIVTLVVMFVANSLVFYSLYTFNKVDNIPLLTIDSPLIFPFLVAVTLLILLLSILITQFKFWKEHKIDRETHLANMRDLRTVILYFLALVVYVMVVEKLHFKLTTLIFCMGTMFAFSGNELNGNILKKTVILLAMSLCIVYSIDIVFNKIFLVALP